MAHLAEAGISAAPQDMKRKKQAAADYEALAATKPGSQAVPQATKPAVQRKATPLEVRSPAPPAFESGFF